MAHGLAMAGGGATDDMAYPAGLDQRQLEVALPIRAGRHD